jgi:diguanylate cyclase (GGDEF)-like protein
MQSTLPMSPSRIQHPPASLDARYQVLLDIGRALTGTLSGEEELFTALYRETARVMEADGFYVSTYDEKSDLATIVFWADRGEGRHASIHYQGSESDVIRTGRPSLVTDALETQSLLVIGDDDSQVTRSAISAPLRSRGRILGVMSAQSYHPSAYSEPDLELLQAIADLAAVALENVHHVEELEQRRNEAERMEELSRTLATSLDSDAVFDHVAEAAADLLEADGAVVGTIEGERFRVGGTRGPGAPFEQARLHLPPELRRRLARRERPVLIRDLHASDLLPEELRFPALASTAGIVPLRAGDRLIGALMVTSARPDHFGADASRLLQRVGGHAAVAIENARLHSALQTLSVTDPLTGLPNRRQLEVHLSREFAAARRGRPLSVVLFDVDYFKEYNDSAGHLAGDQALRGIARVLADETRAMNLVARYGGDEFLAVLSDTGVEGAELHARRVHAAMADDPELGPLGITVSSGIATFAEGMERLEDLIRVADQDMYRSKAANRDPENMPAWARSHGE